MSNHFKPHNISVRKEADAGFQDTRVIKLDAGNKQEVSQFQIPAITQTGHAPYAKVKSTKEALKKQEQVNAAAYQKGSRFMINPLLKTPLSIDQEEKKALEEKVQAKLSELSEQAQKSGYDAGYEEGLKKGKEEAYQAFLSEGSERLDHLLQMIEGFEKAKMEIFQANERFVMEIVFRVARLLALKEIQKDGDYISRLSREVIEKLGVRENIKIRINPRDLESAQKIKQDLEAKLGAFQNLAIEPTAEVELGGCIVETDFSMVDASIETQLKQCYDGLIGGQPT